MKGSILFLTYYYPPCNATGANRPGSFTKNLSLHGYKVTVITRNWSGKEKTWEDQVSGSLKPITIDKRDNVEIHYLSYLPYKYFLSLGFINSLIENFKGNFNYELKYGQYVSYIKKLMFEKRFDYLMVSTPPLTTVKVGALMAEKFNVPLIVDIRDFENDIVLYKEKKYSWLRWQQHRLVMKYFKRWMKYASIIFTASPPITEYLAKATAKDVFTLNNGFNEDLLDINESQYKDRFHITVTGTLYEMANLQVMVDTCRLIYERNPSIDIQFNFIGLLVDEQIADRFRKVIPHTHLNITHRKPQDEAMKIASCSHVLMLAGFDEMRGAYTTKVFEYLGLRRTIIQIPGDRDVVEELIHTTGSGATPHIAEEAYTTIMDWFSEWQNTGTLKYAGNINEIVNWSREEQFIKLLERLKNASI